ncbi:hypothetical protein Tco_0891818, partial [Tanacetum coccineum]
VRTPRYGFKTFLLLTLGLYSGLRDLLLLPWPDLELHLSGDEFLRKLKFICHWSNPFKDFERSNVSGIKLSSFSESDHTFLSLQALSNLHYLFSGFMDYLWSQLYLLTITGSTNIVLAVLTTKLAVLKT